MKQYTVFLDVDGTLCNDLGKIPQSAIKAIHRARNNGHRILLCTGRCKAELFDEITDIGFDGILGSGGGYIEYQGTILHHQTFSDQQLKMLFAYFQLHEIGYYAECNHGMFVDHRYYTWLKQMILEMEKQQIDTETFQDFIERIHIIEEVATVEKVNKLSFLSTGYPYKQIYEDLHRDFQVIPNTVTFLADQGGEIALKGITKAKAMELLYEAIDIDPQATIAIGDSHNDIEMLQYAQIGIAMGNASAEVKEIADDVTASHDEDGIWVAFQKYGLIS